MPAHVLSLTLCLLACSSADPREVATLGDVDEVLETTTPEAETSTEPAEVDTNDTNDTIDTDEHVPVVDTTDPIDTAPPDGFPIAPAPNDEPFGRPVPDAMLPTDFSACAVAGQVIPRNGMDVIDDCRICQCTWRGGRCARRATCARDVCVFVDGTVARPGEHVRVSGCFVCTCDAAGGTCVRDVEAPCPVDGCLVPYPSDEPVVIAFGTERFVSECHRCLCDEATGTTCHDLCHPECFVGDTLVEDQQRMPAADACGSCVCDYGSMRCDPRGCDPSCGVEQSCTSD